MARRKKTFSIDLSPTIGNPQVNSENEHKFPRQESSVGSNQEVENKSTAKAFEESKTTEEDLRNAEGRDPLSIDPILVEVEPVLQSTPKETEQDASELVAVSNKDDVSFDQKLLEEGSEKNQDPLKPAQNDELDSHELAALGSPGQILDSDDGISAESDQPLANDTPDNPFKRMVHAVSKRIGAAQDSARSLYNRIVHQGKDVEQRDSSFNPERALTAGSNPNSQEAKPKKSTSSHKAVHMPRILVTNPISKFIGHWYDRLVGAVSDRTLSGQEEEYSSGHTGRDFIWNSIGVASWGFVFPLLTIVVTRLVGVEQAGMFSLAFITGLMLMFVANYGVRTFQVSDVSEEYTFQEYQVNRFITCIIMIAAGVAYLLIRGYDNEMLIISAGVYAYKLIDGLADVYEGRLQQVDKLYLAGISQTFRSVLAVLVFTLILAVSKNLPAACIGMAIAAAITLVVITYPLAMFETPRSKGVSSKNIWELLKLCFPLFLALFMYNLIDNMPKFLMEGRLGYENQLYFNALYFPAHSILLIAGFLYKPLLLRLAQQWADPDQRKKFDWTIIGIMAFIVVLTVAMMGIMGWIGLPIMSWLYGLDFEQFKGLCFIMLAAGGVTAAIDFIYQVITVLRRQNTLIRSYLITFGFSLFVPILLIEFTGLPGAVIGYLIVMTILLVLLMSEYVSIRLEFTHQGIEEIYQAGTYEYYQYLYGKGDTTNHQNEDATIPKDSEPAETAADSQRHPVTNHPHKTK